MQQPSVRRLIVGENQPCSELEKRLCDSFLNTLIQTIQYTTTDIKEITRLGRALWPRYIEPLTEHSFDKTLASVTAKQSVVADGAMSEPIHTQERDILALLDRRIMPHMRSEMEYLLFSIASVDRWANTDKSGNKRLPPPHDLPKFAKYLLLAAFLCQVNRPDRDRYLFSIQKNGRRRRHDGGEDDDDEAVLGSSLQYNLQSRIPRPKAFPLERMLSVYVSLVGLHHSESSLGHSSHEEMLCSLGSSAFSETLSHLRDIGILNECPARTETDEVRLIEPRYWCSLSLEEAQKMAAEISFPLDRYLL